MRFVIYRDCRNVGEDEFSAYGAKEMRIVPVIAGSKRAGLIQTTIGIVMIAVATITTDDIGGFAAGGAWGFVGAAGASLALGGVIQMFSPQAQGLRQSAAPENLPSYALGSTRNTTAGRNSVPIYYRKRRWGGAIVSASICAENRT